MKNIAKIPFNIKKRVKISTNPKQIAEIFRNLKKKKSKSTPKNPEKIVKIAKKSNKRSKISIFCQRVKLE